MQKFEYSYEDFPDPGASQYDGEYDPSGHSPKIVEAKYLRSQIHAGNPLIECLPPLLKEDDCIAKYTNAIIPPTLIELSRMDVDEKIYSTQLIDDIRIFLPYQLTLEREFRHAIERSYHGRYIVQDERLNPSLTIRNQQFTQHQSTYITRQSEAIPGFSLIGLSGSGKSTSINTMLSGYPQVYIHNPGKWDQFTQILYLHVECPERNGFTELYKNIGKSIDRALGNVTQTYEKMLTKRGSNDTLGRLNKVLSKLIEVFSIGIIIFDEIELLDLKSSRESSIQSLLTLSNDTGIAISVVGTQDAYNDLFRTRRTARRTGVLISASAYCKDKKRFEDIVSNLLMFQWTSPPVTLTPDIIDELFKQTDGVISFVKDIYRKIVEAAISGKKITMKRVSRIIKDYYSSIQYAHTQEKNPLSDEQTDITYEEIMSVNSAYEQIESSHDNEIYEEITKKDPIMQYAFLRESVVNEISATHKEYSKEQIVRSFNIVIKKEGVRDITITSAALQTLIHLQKTADKKRRPETRRSSIDRVSQGSRAQEELEQNNNTVSERILPL